MKLRLKKRDIAMLVAGGLLASLFISPAGAHVGGTIAHLWGHLKPKVTDLVYTKSQSDSRYLGKTAKAANADKLDGQDSTAFAPGQAEAWREVGTQGQPPFDPDGDIICQWTNFDAFHNSVAFYKDPWGQVHLKGLAKMIGGTALDDCNPAAQETDRRIFTLPEGYRPAVRTVLTVMSSGVVGRVNVDPDGDVAIDEPTTEAQARVWVTLDGLDFRSTS